MISIDLQVSTASFTLRKIPRAFSRTKSFRRRGFTGLWSSTIYWVLKLPVMANQLSFTNCIPIFCIAQPKILYQSAIEHKQKGTSIDYLPTKIVILQSCVELPWGSSCNHHSSIISQHFHTFSMVNKYKWQLNPHCFSYIPNVSLDCEKLNDGSRKSTLCCAESSWLCFSTGTTHSSTRRRAQAPELPQMKRCCRREARTSGSACPRSFQGGKSLKTVPRLTICFACQGKARGPSGAPWYCQFGSEAKQISDYHLWTSERCSPIPFISYLLSICIFYSHIFPLYHYFC